MNASIVNKIRYLNLQFDLLEKIQCKKQLVNESHDRKQLEVLEEGVLDKIQLALDGLGLIPGIGEIADGINAIISIGRGNMIEAALSAISMIPAAGDAVGKGGKIILKILDPILPLLKKLSSGGDVKKIVKSLDPDIVKMLSQHGDKIKDFKNLLAKYGDDLEKIFNVLKKGDAQEALKAIGVTAEIPGPAKKLADKGVKHIAEKLPEVEIMLQSLYKFLVEVTESLMGDEEVEAVVAESLFFPAYSLRRVAFTNEMINSQLRECSRKIGLWNE